MKTKFYTASQNNSGGYFIQNDDVREYVIVEATSSEDASNTFEKIVDGYSEYCSCCGERWYEWWDEKDGKDIPMIYGESVYEKEKGMFSKSAIIYYLDGRKEIVELK